MLGYDVRAWQPVELVHCNKEAKVLSPRMTEEENRNGHQADFHAAERAAGTARGERQRAALAF
jgi:hypothetical protein